MELKMKALTTKKLQETFLNKICTIITTTVNKTNFDDEQFSDFFTGLVESLDEDGVFIKHHITACKSFYAWNYIVGILEEQVIEQSDPRYKEITEKIEPIIQAKKTQNQSPYIDPELLMNLAKNNSIMIQKKE